MKKNDLFNTYDKIIKFVNDYARENNIKRGVRISKPSLSQLKTNSKLTSQIDNIVPNLPEITSFFEYVEKRVPDFKAEDLLIKRKT